MVLCGTKHTDEREKGNLQQKKAQILWAENVPNLTSHLHLRALHLRQRSKSQVCTLLFLKKINIVNKGIFGKPSESSASKLFLRNTCCHSCINDVGRSDWRPPKKFCEREQFSQPSGAETNSLAALSGESEGKWGNIKGKFSAAQKFTFFRLKRKKGKAKMGLKKDLQYRAFLPREGIGFLGLLGEKFSPHSPPFSFSPAWPARERGIHAHPPVITCEYSPWFGSKSHLPVQDLY